MAKPRSPRVVELTLRPEPAPRAKKTAQPEIARMIKLYHDEHLQRHGFKPLINGKHASLIGQMIANWDEDTVERLIVDFVRGNDPWAVKCGWTIEAFYQCAPRILTRGSQIDERTASNVDAALRATQKR